MTRQPKLLAFLLADKVYRELETGKVHVSGTFNQLAAPSIPMIHQLFYVYLCLTDLKAGNRLLTLDIRYLDTGEEVFKVNQPVDSQGPQEVIEMNLCFKQITFQQEGTIELILTCDDKEISNRTLSIKKIEHV